jgi:elongation factor P
LFFNDKPISIDLPNFVELQITECEPAVKGDTKANAQKLATMQTGATVGVPMFVDNGEWIRIDTRTGEYVERVKR